MPPSRFENSYSWGDIFNLVGLFIQAVVIVAPIIGFWYGLSNRMNNVESNVTSMNSVVSELSRDLPGMQSDIRANKQYIDTLTSTINDQRATNAQVLATLSLIQQDIAVIKSRDGLDGYRNGANGNSMVH